MSEVETFYDEFAADQVARGFNLRHRRILRKFVEAGLAADSDVLELGCGVGSMTPFIASLCHKGSVHGVDISPKSIMEARSRCRAPNATFSVGSVTDWQPDPDRCYDFVTLFDVLEHVPIAEHGDVFELASLVCRPAGTVLIHIPSPGHIEYLRETSPEVLQVIDQPVWADGLMRAAYAAGFELRHFTTHSIWAEGDYQWMVFAPRVPFRMVPLG